MEPVIYRRAVFYYETDRMDCVHHSNYIRWFEEARIHLMQVCGFPYDRLESSGILSPVLEAQAQYRTMARFGETVEVSAKIESYTGTRIRFAYAVRDSATGVLRCAGYTVHCFVNREGRPLPLKKACLAYHQKIEEVLGEE